MCGFTGYWGNTAADTEIATRMADQISHRGPDDSGVWVDSKSDVALAHRRLSILDLSPAGHQPMHSPCGRYTLVYNGEIYNHLDLRAELDQEGGAFNWRGHSDTETILAACRHWGVEGALNRFNGMFAFALWDNAEQVLFLARDRMGEKPLYYGQSAGTLLFGSELKALAAHPNWTGRLNRDALALFLRHNYVPSPWSIYQGIHKLPPAHFVAITDKGRNIGEPRSYWNIKDIAAEETFDATSKELTDNLEKLLFDAIGRRMAADVPLGAFLSGGYDSSTVVALMQAQSTQAVKTFSIGFNEQGFDEAPHASAVAKHLGTDHTELYVSANEALNVIPQLPAIYDEPFSDSSQIPTFLVSKLARTEVTVSLSGDGGDELFMGYERYFIAQKIWGKIGKLPPSARKKLALLIGYAPGKTLESLQRILPKNLRTSNLADRIPKLAEILSHDDAQQLYRSLISHSKDPSQLVLVSQEPETVLSKSHEFDHLNDLESRMMLLDMLTYLPDDILTKVDRASMAVSLEARVPLLDHRVVEFALRTPTQFKHRDGQGKWLIKQVLYRHVPRNLMERPKMGFGVPIEHWLRGPLREWAEDLLDENRLRDEGIFDPKPIRKMWHEHLNEDRRWHYYLWDVLMFQAWQDGKVGL
ncbi:MAG: asparagine synthase (glutamine-hydrolyzing) [Pseudomonadota bacterium]